MRTNTPKDQIELMKRAEFKPITTFDLQKNEYFDIRSDDFNVSDMTVTQFQEQITALENKLAYDK